MTLRNEQIALLDRMSAEIRGRSGAVVDRSALLRVAVDAMLAEPVPAVRSEEELREWLENRLGRDSRRRK